MVEEKKCLRGIRFVQPIDTSEMHLISDIQILDHEIVLSTLIQLSIRSSFPKPY